MPKRKSGLTTAVGAKVSPLLQQEMKILSIRTNIAMADLWEQAGRLFLASKGITVPEVSEKEQLDAQVQGSETS